MTMKLLNWRQARWSKILTLFDYQSVYRRNLHIATADAFTRRQGDFPKRADERLQNIEQVVLEPQHLPEQLWLLADSLPVQGRPSTSNLFNQAYIAYRLPDWIHQAVRKTGTLKEVNLVKCTEQERRFVYWGKCYVPETNQSLSHITQDDHDTALVGHPGRVKKFDLLEKKHYWKNVRKQVDWYVSKCHDCEMACSLRQSMFPILWPSSVPAQRSEDISLDFVVQILECDRYDAIWAVVDRLW